ncbi:hypothetical protein V6N13_076569 [Hibiscus sabdariffa]|uniref:Uncharacterized protein n=2 Tax=Hibiscus sabdariffa TaxID=183260 RepID=A0ABR2B306_9ROSI
MEAQAQAQAQLHRTCWIESEPRTLSMDQIHCAREAAMYVVNTTSTQEAFTIFTQGLEPVVSVARQHNMELETTILDHVQDLHLQGIRDVASAPF